MKARGILRPAHPRGLRGPDSLHPACTRRAVRKLHEAGQGGHDCLHRARSVSPDPLPDCSSPEEPDSTAFLFVELTREQVERLKALVEPTGRPKVEAIRAALRGRFLNVLITDEDTALALVG